MAGDGTTVRNAGLTITARVRVTDTSENRTGAWQATLRARQPSPNATDGAAVDKSTEAASPAAKIMLRICAPPTLPDDVRLDAKKFRQIVRAAIHTGR